MSATDGVLERDIERALGGLDMERLARRFRDEDELIFFDPLFPRAVVDRLLPEVERLRGRAHRVRVPGYKKSGSVSSFQLDAEAPGLSALYRSPAFLTFLRTLTGQPLGLAPADDPQAHALYYYGEPGDRVGMHRDRCHYERGAAYTLLMGLVDRSQVRLVCRPGTCTQRRHDEERRYATGPGSMVIFNGSRVLHGVTPLARGEERVVYTALYLTDPTVTRWQRLLADVNYAVNYFGPSILLRRLRRSNGR